MEHAFNEETHKKFQEKERLMVMYNSSGRLKNLLTDNSGLMRLIDKN
jgi:hypothetical protein|tara:strand:+ start:471 stop:611 length:141 start_codon:yes stop_codon:yes gene_type:complete